MKKVITMNKSLDDAVGMALNAIEKGDFNKVIKLLEYVKKYKKDYDEVMVNYALLISYMNTGQTSKAADVMVILDELEIKNPQIDEVLKAIKKDLLRVKKNKENSIKEVKDLTYEQIIGNLNLEDRLKILGELYAEYGEGTIWSSLVNPSEIEELRHNYAQYLSIHRKWLEYVIEFKGFNENVTPLDVFEYLREIEDDYFFWFNFNFHHLELILNNPNMHQFVKNFILERLAFYTQKKIIPVYNIKLSELNSEITTYDLPVFTDQKNELITDINSFYSLVTEVDSDAIEAMVASIVDIILISNYPNDLFEESDIIKAVVAYIVNDVYLGREYDVMIKEKLNISFEQVKSEIKRYEKLIAYLIT